MSTQAKKLKAEEDARRALDQQLYILVGRTVKEVRITRVRWSGGTRWAAMAIGAGGNEIPLYEHGRAYQAAIILRQAFPDADWSVAQDYDAATGVLSEHVVREPSAVRKRLPPPDHQHAAGQARTLPGQWVLAGGYSSRASAMAAAVQVRSGERLPAYLPAGAFASRAELTQDGADLWVRYIADSATHDFRESLASGLTEDLAAYSRRVDAADARRI